MSRRRTGMFLVRGSAARRLDEFRRASAAMRAGQPRPDAEQSDGPGPTPEPSDPGSGSTSGTDSNGAGAITKVTLTAPGIPGDKMREVVKVAVLPLNQVSTMVRVDLIVHADGGLATIPKETLDLVVLDGLRQLDIEPEVSTE